MEYGVTCKSDSKATTTKKRLTRRKTLPISKALLLSLVLAVIASLSLFMPSALQAQAEGGANDTSYAMSIGSKVLEEAAKRSDDEPVAARFYLGQAPWGDIDSGDKTTPALWDVLGPANTNDNKEDAINFIADKTAAGSNSWGVYSSQDPKGQDLTASSILAISHNVTTQSVFSSSSSQAYQRSNLQNTMDNLSYFSQPEKAFALYTYKTDAATTDIYSNNNFKESQNILQGSQFFPLSAREAVTYWPNNQDSNSLRKASGAHYGWWLRSAWSGSSGFAGAVDDRGGVIANLVSDAYGVRAAFNSNLDSVVYTTYAGPNYVLPKDSLKSQEVDSTETKTLRLSLHDKTLDGLQLKNSDIKAQKGKTINIDFSDFPDVEGTNLTVLITNSTTDDVLYAGSYAHTQGQDSASVTIPDKLQAGTYTLYVVPETDNNTQAKETEKGKFTNYAAALTDSNKASLTVEEVPEPDPDNPKPEEEQGWNYNESGGWYYVYDNDGNTYNDGWHWIEDAKFGNHWYYFKEDSFIKTNEWIFDDVNTSWYYVNSSGSMNVGTWNFINGAWYGFNWNGTMCTGWTFDSGYNNWFYCDPTTGAMYTNCWSFINGAWYGFWANGEMCRGWVWDSSYHAWFYCSPSDGHMYTNGWYRINNKSYYFNASGLLV